ncbi:MAG: hypothetical protein L6R42_001189 [Xanthoria sp. 1 TBL-2021]|nr:MAG: hypothetical protein L6R42_001189 [Xanthoria sp. 1 TBL-2021]
MTGTLPPFASFELEKLLYFTQYDRLRASSDRPNLEYCVQSIGSSPPRLERDGHLLGRATAICIEETRRWSFLARSDVACSHSLEGARGICFVRNKDLIERLVNAKKLGCYFYHGDLSHLERGRIVLVWNQGTAGNEEPLSVWIVATSAFSAGVHYLSVRRVLHLGAPDGLLNYGQETGRAGRDGLHAACTVLLGPKWKVAWEEQYHNNFLAKDRSEMNGFLTFKGCRRQFLTTYLDGGQGTAYNPDRSQPAGEIACDKCARRTGQPPRKSRSPSSSIVMPTTGDPRFSLPSIEPPISPVNTAASTVIDSERSVACSHQLLARLALQSSPPRRSSPGPKSSPTRIIASSPILQDREIVEPTENQENEDDDRDEDSLSQDLDGESLLSSSMQSTKKVFDVAAQLVRNEAMDQEECRALYEQQVAVWGRACLLCSFDQRYLVEGEHEDCMQKNHEESLRKHRRTPRFEANLGCSYCTQPFCICQ